MKRILLMTMACFLLAACSTPQKMGRSESRGEHAYSTVVAKATTYYQNERNSPAIYWISGGNPLGSLLTRATLNRDSVAVKELRDHLRVANKQGQIVVIAGDNDDFAAMVAIEALRSIVGNLESLTLGFSGSSHHVEELNNLALGKGIRFNRL